MICPYRPAATTSSNIVSLSNRSESPSHAVASISCGPEGTSPPSKIIPATESTEMSAPASIQQTSLNLGLPCHQRTRLSSDTTIAQESSDRSTTRIAVAVKVVWNSDASPL